ncbi:MAG: hypothetical protein ACM34I_00420 [bacterium]
MKRIRNEKGIALVMVLVLSAVALAVMAGLIFMITGRTQLSGGGKRYATALDCAKGGIDIVTEIISKGMAMETPDKTGLMGNFVGINFNMPISQECLWDKLSGTWSSLLNCDKDISTIKENPDFSFDLGSDPTCRVYGKIIQALPGNTREVGWLEKGGVSTASKGSGAGEIAVIPIPSDYTVEIESVMIDTATDKPKTGERAKLSVLYAY